MEEAHDWLANVLKKRNRPNSMMAESNSAARWFFILANKNPKLDGLWFLD
jgi:hypothetical protein